jgi:uncharacterized membrane protein
MNDNAKTIAIVSYITLIGWIVAIIMHNNEQNKSEFAIFHIRQSLGLMLSWICIPLIGMFVSFIPFVGWFFGIVSVIVYVGVFVLWVLGIIAAINNERKDVPFLGQIFQKLLKDIK